MATGAARGPRRRVALLAALGCAVAPAGASAQEATAGVGLSAGASSISCVLYQLSGCPVPNPGNALFDRYQALSVDQTGGANSFRYGRTGIPWDAVSTGGSALGSPCTPESPPPLYYGTPWIELAERYVLAARAAGIDPLIAITTNGAARYPGNGNPRDPANPTANQYFCAFKGLVSTLDAFAAGHGVRPPTEYEIYDEPDGAMVSNECNPTPDGDLPPHYADQCAAWYYYEADRANRTLFGTRLTLVALAADGDSANDPDLVAIKAYASYLTGTIGLYPTVWSFHPYEDLSEAGLLDDGATAHRDTTRVSAYIASLYGRSRPQPTIWLTEVAAQLTDPVDTYFGAPAGCKVGEADDSPPTLGGCLDGNPRAQAYAASDFLSLARSGAAFPGQITRIYWHEFDSVAGQPTTWDSGLVSPGDSYTRASYCVLSGESVAATLTDPGCDSKAGAEASEDSLFHHPEPNVAVPIKKDPAGGACPQPWCTFSLVRLRLAELGSAASPEPLVTAGAAQTR
ncbi:MAG TPA: hypothetical protein VMF57_03870 [Solirubrobacteraceae bacterium]|nr:hypothetical protein [Solirubrobacteraceae bacterium]